jgi:hypothetical protein
MRLPTLLLIACASCSTAFAAPLESRPARPTGAMESVDQALCRMIETSAVAHRIDAAFFTRLIWRESSFRLGATSPAGARGVAQFMPRTAIERGLADPFDPEQAIPKAAELLAEHVQAFGNFGLAAAAYNGGAARLRTWIASRGELPAETRDFVLFVTGRSVDAWVGEAKAGGSGSRAPPGDARPCLQLAATLRRPGREGVAYAGSGGETAFAPWGVQLAGNFSKALALASYARARQAYRAIVGEVTPMIIGTRLMSRGTRAFYRVRAPAPNRVAADKLCDKIRAAGGSCLVLRS